VLTLPAAAGLIVILAGAIYLDCFREVAAKRPRDPCDWVAKVLYMPEAQLVILLLAIIILGPGVMSGDHLLGLLLGRFG